MLRNQKAMLFGVMCANLEIKQDGAAARCQPEADDHTATGDAP